MFFKNISRYHGWVNLKKIRANTKCLLFILQWIHFYIRKRNIPLLSKMYYHEIKPLSFNFMLFNPFKPNNEFYEKEGNHKANIFYIFCLWFYKKDYIWDNPKKNKTYYFSSVNIFENIKTFFFWLPRIDIGATWCIPFSIEACQKTI